MKELVKICSSVIFASFLVSNAYAVTHSCECDVEKLHAGFVGGTGNGTKSKVDCVNGSSYVLGQLNDDLGKARHSMALAAQMSGKKLKLHYWSSDGSLNCAVASSDTTIFPAGFYVE